MRISVTPYAIELLALHAMNKPDVHLVTIVVQEFANLQANTLHNVN